MSGLSICNGPDCTRTTYHPTREGWMMLLGWTSPPLDFHSWECLRAYAEREVLNAQG